MRKFNFLLLWNGFLVNDSPEFIRPIRNRPEPVVPPSGFSGTGAVPHHQVVGVLVVLLGLDVEHDVEDAHLVLDQNKDRLELTKVGKLLPSFLLDKMQGQQRSDALY